MHVAARPSLASRGVSLDLLLSSLIIISTIRALSLIKASSRE
jgi:hypothetical protein